jgi:hypothetical protein
MNARVLTHRHIAGAVLAAIVMSFAACSSSTPTQPSPAPMQPSAPAQPFVLGGTWERINSSFVALDGMVVEISADGTQALIVSTPANPYQFQVGDVKWRSITRVSDTRFSFEDLLRQSGSGAMSYVPGFIDALNDGAELGMTFPSTGTLQQWRVRN